jgi:DNA polymerase III epsilon subunit-like protein
MTRIAVIDFETTGLSPAMGDPATEIAICVLEGGEVVNWIVEFEPPAQAEIAEFALAWN